MKLAVRVFALSLAVAGVAAASHSSSSRTVQNGQAVSATLPTPVCGPGMPGCPTGGVR